MRRLSAFIVCLALTPLFSVPDAWSAALESRADYAVLMDADSGIVLFEKEADKAMAPASMSKLMTLAMLFDKLKSGSLTLEDKFYVSEKAWKMGGSKMWTQVDTEIRIEDLIRGIIVQSGNDACIVVAEGISGTEEAFARDMTSFGRDIGLKNSTFANSSGWPDPDHRMSAMDLAVLTRHIVREYPDHYGYFAEKEFTWSGITQPNRNPLLYADLGADGLKTGRTDESGHGLVSSAVQDGRRLILVVNGLGSESDRSTESQRLLRVGFRDFDNYPLFQGGDVVGEAEVWQGANGTVGLRIEDPLTVILRSVDRREMKVTINYSGLIPAPIAEGQEIAELRVTTPGGVDLVRPLYAAVDVGTMGVFGKLTAAAIHLVTERLSTSRVDSP